MARYIEEGIVVMRNLLQPLFVSTGEAASEMSSNYRPVHFPHLLGLIQLGTSKSNPQKNIIYRVFLI